MPPKKQPFRLVLIPKKKHFSPNLTQNKSFGKWWNYLILPSSPKKNPFGKEKKNS